MFYQGAKCYSQHGMLLSNTRENAYMLTVHCIVIPLFFNLIAGANNAALLVRMRLSAETESRDETCFGSCRKKRGFDCSADLFTPDLPFEILHQILISTRKRGKESEKTEGLNNELVIICRRADVLGAMSCNDAMELPSHLTNSC